MRGICIIGVGTARSGKSTWSNRWVKQHPGRVILCSDDIRLALGHRYNSHIELHVSAIKHTMLEALLSRGHDVFVDGTHTTITSIKNILAVEPDAILEFFPSLEIIGGGMWPSFVQEYKQRALDTQQPDLLKVIDQMAFQLVTTKKEWQENEHAIRAEARQIKEKKRIV